jgi:SH3-like domain-containing protein
MSWLAHIRLLFLAAALGLAALAPAWAQDLVSARNPTINMRAAPSTDAEVLWRLARGYPLQVLERRGDWLRVQDFEGDQGWVARSVVGDTPHHIVRSPRANLRAGPGTQHRVVHTAVYGDILRTVRRQGDWVQVQRPDGRGNAWVASELLWGW